MDLYAEDCVFSDPTIPGFKGTQRYVRNLRLLKGFFIAPRITLYGISSCPTPGDDTCSSNGHLKVRPFRHCSVCIKLPTNVTKTHPLKKVNPLRQERKLLID